MFHDSSRGRHGLRAIPPRGLLVISAVLFGSTFAPAQSALDHLTPWGVVLFRFGVATAVLLPFSGRQFGAARLEPRAYARAGLVAGVINAFGFLVLSAALENTTASNAAFLSSLFVVFVPVLAAVLARVAPTPPVLAGVSLAVAGSFLLSGASLSIGTGDALAVGDALVGSMHILTVAHFAPRLLATPFNLAQLAVSALVMVPLAIAFGIGELTFAAVLAASYCGVAQAAALGLQVRAQRSVDATSSALILLLVPVSGAALASVVLRERLGGWGMAGAGLIVAAVVVAEVLPARRAARRAHEPPPATVAP
ncbi:MAG: DMT(drug/metabolite transporter) superfamily permease [Acidimicrobiales bacterium]|nr:DMT(drug/metabolite transporter) superfamily permease [Acidimicrobiales bacterium]